MARDRVFDVENQGVGSFSFDEKVAAVFEDMLVRSIPNYEQLQGSCASLAPIFAQPNSAVYDIGCSMCTTLQKIAAKIGEPSVRLVGIDNSAPMLSECRKKLQALNLSERIELQRDEAQNVSFADSSLVIMNYTLQFIEVEARAKLLGDIYQALLPGGALILSEKVHYEDAERQAEIEHLYYEFKRRNGYSETEIQQKRKALEGVLIPLTIEENIELLKSLGFRKVRQILQGYCFHTWIAEK